MGRHASAERRRSVAAWPIVVGVVVLALIGVTVLYFQLIHRDPEDASGCSSTTVLPVVAAPGVAPAVEQAAQAFNATHPVARSTCVSASVSTVSGSVTVTALAGGWQTQRTPAPGLWIADSAADVAALDAARPAMTAGHPTQGVARSPVVLAVRHAPGGAPVSWASLAAGSTALDLGIEDPAANRASAAALQSLVRGASTSPADGDGIDVADVSAAASMLTRLAGSSSTAPATTDQALTELAAGRSRYTAVPVLESDLATFNGASSTSLTAVYPSGPTAAAEMMPIPITASWVTNTMSDAAAAFDAYLGTAGGTKILTAAHLRTTGASSAASGVDLSTPVTALSAPGATASAALTAAWTAAVSGAAQSTASTGATAPTDPLLATPPGPTSSSSTTAATPTSAGSALSTTPAPRASPATATSVAGTSNAAAAGPAITFLVDTSASMSTLQNGVPRVTWAEAAISTVVRKDPRNSFGLWSYAATTSSAVPLGPVDQAVQGVPRASAIANALHRLTPSGDSYTYGAIQTVLAAAAGDAVTGGTHRVILLTDGYDSTPGLSRAAVKATVAALVKLHPNIRLDIVGLSSGVNAEALTEIAAAGGGTFTPVDNLSVLEPALLALSS